MCSACEDMPHINCMFQESRGVPRTHEFCIALTTNTILYVCVCVWRGLVQFGLNLLQVRICSIYFNVDAQVYATLLVLIQTLWSLASLLLLL